MYVCIFIAVQEKSHTKKPYTSSFKVMVKTAHVFNFPFGCYFIKCINAYIFKAIIMECAVLN